ncbi:hypothetical protein EGH25_00525 [Haladaptatus sp. F3-133]|jgi:hypothetical protein|uniref:Uncharacterized protein n=1 Tax=Halorutilus salinus TaxID=2487751 RepID=A0A9Q4GI10_9EURY|nr:hypothetical protein [Halorutilus salinus]MCX2817851.1 hypothetical protein [Halorutilus salinus]
MGVTNKAGEEPLVSTPENPVGYVMVLLAVVTGAIHLLLAVSVISFSTTLGVLFALNGIGFFGGTAVYFTRFWRRELYVVAALYALATIVALFVFQGFGVEAFYRQGSLNPMAVVSKAVEVGIVVCALYLYSESS